MEVAQKATPPISTRPAAAESAGRRKLTVEEGVFIIMVGVGIVVLCVLGLTVYLVFHLVQSLLA